MIKKKSMGQEGIAHLGLIILFVAVLGAISFAGFRIYQSNNGSDDEVTELLEVDTAAVSADVAVDEGQEAVDSSSEMTEENDAL